MLRPKIEKVLRQTGGSSAVVLAEPGRNSNSLISINAEQLLPAASLYKIGVMTAVFQGIATREIELEQHVTVTQRDVDLYGDAPASDPGTVLTVEEATRRMITVSDNSAAGALIDLVGFDAVNRAFRESGMSHSHLGNLPDTVPRSPAETTAADQVSFYRRLLLGQVVDAPSSRQMLRLLEDQQENDRLPADLPPGTVVAHKTGELDGVRNDAGIIFTPAGPIICAVLISDQPAAGQAADAIASIGRLAYDAMVMSFV